MGVEAPTEQAAAEAAAALGEQQGVDLGAEQDALDQEDARARIDAIHAAEGNTEVPGHEEPAGVPESDPPGELVIEADGQLSLVVGGKRPTSSSLRLTGGKIEVQGQFEKGSRVAVRVEAVVDEIGFKDETDSKTGQVVGSARTHKARIVNVQVLPS